MKNHKGKILIVDDNQQILDSLQILLKPEFAVIDTVRNPNILPNRVRSESYDIILLDMNFSAGVTTGNEGIYWLREILKHDPTAIVVLITAYGDIDLAVRAIKEGATDFITKPWDAEKLLITLKTAYKLKQSNREITHLRNQQRQLKEDIDKQHSMFVGSSRSMSKVYDIIKKVAKTDADILITGENGTGKELIAREIHRQSNRVNEVFVSVDMAALSAMLFESELFGHVKGAFTDARDDRIGRFEIASGGTLFLDEIGNLSISLQAKLLTAIQSREIVRLGSNTPIPVDIRLITATNKPLPEMVAQNLFREDLLYRVNTIQIEVPPLRDRGEDILLLTEFFLKQYANKYEKPNLRLNSKACDKLMLYHWPGNVRELKHTIEKVVILSETNTLKPEDFMFNVAESPNIEDIKSHKLADLEQRTIEAVLRKCNGNLSQAAKELGISRTTLYTKFNSDC